MLLLNTSLRTDASGRFHFYAIGDLHADSKKFNEARLKRLVAHIAADPLAVVVVAGDYLEGRTPGMKYFDPETLRDDFATRLASYIPYGLDVVTAYLAPIVEARRPIILTSGNHDQYLEGVNFPELLVERLRALRTGSPVLYAGDEALLTIASGTRSRSSRAHETVAHIAHGAGGGMRPGGKVNRQQQQLEWLDGVDIIVSGHVHDANARVIESIGVEQGGGALRVEDRAMLRTCAFVERAVAGPAGYAGRKLYGTNDRGLLYLKPTPSERRIYRAECEF